MVEYIRVCVDEDEELARLAFAKSTMGYALGQTVPTQRERELGYRAHFERMGFGEELADLDQMRREGATIDEVANAFPAEVLQKVGYYGKAEGAAEAFYKLAKGLDTALVSVVSAKPGLESVVAAMRACQPAYRSK